MRWTFHSCWTSNVYSCRWVSTLSRRNCNLIAMTCWPPSHVPLSSWPSRKKTFPRIAGSGLTVLHSRSWPPSVTLLDGNNVRVPDAVNLDAQLSEHIAQSCRHGGCPIATGVCGGERNSLGDLRIRLCKTKRGRGLSLRGIRCPEPGLAEKRIRTADRFALLVISGPECGPPGCACQSPAHEGSRMVRFLWIL